MIQTPSLHLYNQYKHRSLHC